MKTIPRIILLADGRSERWNSPVPKHLIVLRGEVLLHRTVRQLLSRGAADVWITTHREDYRVPGTRSYAPEENKFQIDQFYACRTLWQDQSDVVFLYGDVYFSDAAVDIILEHAITDFVYFQRTKGSIITGKLWKEGFAMRFKDPKILLDACLYLRNEIIAGRLTNEHHQLQGFLEGHGPGAYFEDVIGSHGVEIDDETDDFDVPSDVDRWTTNTEFYQTFGIRIGVGDKGDQVGQCDLSAERGSGDPYGSESEGSQDLRRRASLMVQSEFPPILDKRANYRLWQSGAFGNKLRAWRSMDEWRASGFKGLVVLRSLMDGGGPCDYNLTCQRAEEVARHWIARGHPSDRIMVNEAAPDQFVLLQGEYLNDIHLGGPSYWGYFHYSRVKAQMRDALKEAPEVAQGLRSDLMLRLAMTPSSYEDWLLLLDRYHGHVFEVSIYERCLGDTPGRNALVWEVRRY